MSLLDLFPGKWMIYAGIMAGTFAAGGTAAWKFQSMRYEAKEAERAQQQLALERESHTLELKRQSAVVSAQNAAAARAVGLRRDADSARAGADGLRDSALRSLAAAKAGHDACLVSANAFSVVFAECRERRDSLAEIAGRHANDVQTLTDAWPK
jgi:hypothetical protein